MGDDNNNDRRRAFLEFSKNSFRGMDGFSGNLLTRLRAQITNVWEMHISNEDIQGHIQVRFGTLIMRLLRGLSGVSADAVVIYPRFADLQDGWAITDRALNELGFILENTAGNFDCLNVEELVQIMAWVFFNRDDRRMWVFPNGGGFFPENDRPAARQPDVPGGPRDGDDVQGPVDRP